jgi:predicted phosphoribosyltransferase
MFMGAVGAYYQDFSQTSDEEVAAILAEMRKPGQA